VGGQAVSPQDDRAAWVDNVGACLRKGGYLFPKREQPDRTASRYLGDTDGRLNRGDGDPGPGKDLRGARGADGVEKQPQTCPQRHLDVRHCRRSGAGVEAEPDECQEAGQRRSHAGGRSGQPTPQSGRQQQHDQPGEEKGNRDNRRRPQARSPSLHRRRELDCQPTESGLPQREVAQEAQSQEEREQPQAELPG